MKCPKCNSNTLVFTNTGSQWKHYRCEKSNSWDFEYTKGQGIIWNELDPKCTWTTIIDSNYNTHTQKEEFALCKKLGREIILYNSCMKYIEKNQCTFMQFKKKFNTIPKHIYKQILTEHVIGNWGVLKKI